MKVKKSGWKKMTPTEFDRLKHLFAGGLKVHAVMKQTGRSYYVCADAEKSKTFGEYRDLCRARKSKYETATKKDNFSVTEGGTKPRFLSAKQMASKNFLDVMRANLSVNQSILEQLKIMNAKEEKKGFKIFG